MIFIGNLDSQINIVKIDGKMHLFIVSFKVKLDRVVFLITVKFLQGCNILFALVSVELYRKYLFLESPGSHS